MHKDVSIPYLHFIYCPYVRPHSGTHHASLQRWSCCACAAVQELQGEAPLTLSGEGLWAGVLSSGQCVLECPGSQSAAGSSGDLLLGFGTFEVKERAARTGINPRTKETIQIPEAKVPSFKAGSALKDAVK